MHRFSAILLFVALLLPFAAPLLALGQPADANLPLCCRRGGVHHCSMNMGERMAAATADTQTPHWRAPAGRCPYCPATTGSAHVDPLAEPTVAEALLRTNYAHATGVVQTECRRRIAQDRARQKRGPPQDTRSLLAA